MPTYRYQCRRCEEIHEEFHSISEKPRTKCPACGGKLERLIGRGGGVLLKGSGFYTTDYRSDGYQREAKKDTEAAKGSGGADKKTKDGKSGAGGGTGATGGGGGTSGKGGSSGGKSGKGGAKS